MQNEDLHDLEQKREQQLQIQKEIEILNNQQQLQKEKRMQEDKMQDMQVFILEVCALFDWWIQGQSVHQAERGARGENQARVRNRWLALFELTNHNTSSSIALHILVL